jgi:PleD family two-component response regulator
MLSVSGSNAVIELPKTTSSTLGFFRAKDTDPAALLACARILHMAPQDLGEVTPTTDVTTCLGGKPSVILLPVVEADCLGIKLAQQVLDSATPYAVALYGSGLPAKEYLCLAYRTGVDDVIDVTAGQDTLDVQLRRLLATLHQRQQCFHATDEFQSETVVLTQTCERLQRDNDRWQERLMALANAARDMAMGKRRMAVDTPRLLIVAASQHQAATAQQVAGELGFDNLLVANAQAALTQIKSRPPAIILVDSVLPDQELTAFVKSARQAGGNHPMIIIAWSSNPESEDLLMSPATEIDDFVLKTAHGERTSLLTAALLGGLR